MWGHTDVRGALTVGQGRGNGTFFHIKMTILQYKMKILQ